jgi:hypothetical protein
MADEREDSIRQGMGVPPESRVGQEAAREKQKRAAEGPAIGGGMGGTSDAETAPEESQMNRALSESAGGPEGGAGEAPRAEGP